MLEMNALMPFAPGPSLLQRNVISNRLGWKLSIPNVAHTIEETGFLNPELLWIDSLFQNYWVDLVKPERTYMRIADHPEYITKLSASLRKSLYTSLRRAELIITPTKRVAQYLKQATPAAIEVIPNGVNLAYFQKSAALPKIYEQDSRPKVVFVGSLAAWIDFDLLQRLVDSSPDLAFYLIGPVQTAKKLPQADNLYYLGSIEYDLISGYLQHANVALAPFDVLEQRQLVESVDALKLYEYIASGLPVVATDWEQSRSLEPWVITADQTAGAFRHAIDQAISQPERHTASAEQLRAFDWSSRLAQLELPGLHKAL